MTFNYGKIETINNNLLDRKKATPIKGHIVGLGVKLHTVGVVVNDVKICNVEDLDRIIKELTMLKETIEEETGLIL